MAADALAAASQATQLDEDLALLSFFLVPERLELALTADDCGEWFERFCSIVERWTPEDVERFRVAFASGPDLDALYSIVVATYWAMDEEDKRRVANELAVLPRVERERLNRKDPFLSARERREAVARVARMPRCHRVRRPVRRQTRVARRVVRGRARAHAPPRQPREEAEPPLARRRA